MVSILTEHTSPTDSYLFHIASFYESKNGKLSPYCKQERWFINTRNCLLMYPIQTDQHFPPETFVIICSQIQEENDKYNIRKDQCYIKYSPNLAKVKTFKY